MSDDDAGNGVGDPDQSREPDEAVDERVCSCAGFLFFSLELS